MDTAICKSSNSSGCLGEEQVNAVAGVSLVTAALSLLGSGSVLICSTYHRKIFSPEVFPTFHLAVADLLSSGLLMVTSAVFLYDTAPQLPGQTGSCAFLLEIVISFYTSSFFLTITYALEALFRFRRRLREGVSIDTVSMRMVSSRWMYLAYVLAWLIPISCGVILIVKVNNLDPPSSVNGCPRQCSTCFADFQFNEEECWCIGDEDEKTGNCTLEHKNLHIMMKCVFLIPLLMVMISNMILYILIRRAYRQLVMRRGLLSYHQRQEESLLKRKTFLYQFVFYLCWTPSVILGIASFISGYSMKTFLPLLVIQALLGPMQGLFNSIVYGWKRDAFRRALTERTSLLSTNRATTIGLRDKDEGQGGQPSSSLLETSMKTYLTGNSETRPQSSVGMLL